MEQLLTASQTASILNVSLRTLRKLFRRGDLAVCRIGRRTLVNPATLARFVQDREDRPNG